MEKKSTSSSGSKPVLNTFDQLKGMIQSKDQTKKIIGTILFGLPIIVVFIFFGLPNDQLSGGGSSAARVNKAFISIQDFTQEEQRIQKMQEYYAQMFGQPFTFDPERQRGIRQQAVESLVQLELLSQATEKENLLVSDKEILSFIQDMPEFKKDGMFQASYYFQLLEANRLNPANFENKIRKQVQTQRSRQLFETAAKPSALELEKLSELARRQWNIQFAQLDREVLGKKIVVADSEISAALGQDEFKKRVQAYFEANRSKYETPEKVSAQVITANFTPGNAESEKKALDRILQLEKRAQTEDFGSLALSSSDDVGTKSKKGDLGYFARGEKEPSLEQAAFSLEKGKVSAPIKGFSSYQLVKLNDRKEKAAAELANNQKSIASELLGKDKFETLQKQLETALAAGNWDQTQQLAKSMGANWEESGLFSLDAQQIPKLAEAELKMAALELNEKKRLSAKLVPIRTANYVLYLKEVKMLDSSKSQDDLRMLGQQAASQLQDDWVKLFRTTSKVQINPLVIQ